MKILVTGFEPFGGDEVNSSWESVKLLETVIMGAEIVKARLPVSFKAVRELIPRLIEEHRPSIIILTGQAKGIPSLHVERVAINVMDARIGDNEGYKPEDEPIFPGAPAAYFATIPIKKVLESIRRANVPAAVSNSAGTFVCNTAMFTALHYVSQKGIPSKIGFIHIPSLPQQSLEGNTPSMAPEVVATGLRACIATCVGELLSSGS
ncbi:MAG: pyroglutamyl-peptidase I [Infirmifilum sp.]